METSALVRDVADRVRATLRARPANERIVAHAIATETHVSTRTATRALNVLVAEGILISAGREQGGGYMRADADGQPPSKSERVRAHLRELIATATPGDLLPSLRDTATTCGVSLTTASAAYHALAGEGLIVPSTGGRGRRQRVAERDG